MNLSFQQGWDGKRGGWSVGVDACGFGALSGDP